VTRSAAYKTNKKRRKMKKRGLFIGSVEGKGRRKLLTGKDYSYLHREQGRI